MPRHSRGCFSLSRFVFGSLLRWLASLRSGPVSTNRNGSDADGDYVPSSTLIILTIDLLIDEVTAIPVLINFQSLAPGGGLAQIGLSQQNRSVGLPCRRLTRQTGHSESKQHDRDLLHCPSPLLESLTQIM